MQLQLQGLLAIEFVGHERVDGADTIRQWVGMKKVHGLEHVPVACQPQFQMLLADDTLRRNVEESGEQRSREALSQTAVDLDGES
jgi:hypothetical protein